MAMAFPFWVGSGVHPPRWPKRHHVRQDSRGSAYPWNRVTRYRIVSAPTVGPCLRGPGASATFGVSSLRDGRLFRQRPGGPVHGCAASHPTGVTPEPSRARQARGRRAVASKCAQADSRPMSARRGARCIQAPKAMPPSGKSPSRPQKRRSRATCRPSACSDDGRDGPLFAERRLDDVVTTHRSTEAGTRHTRLQRDQVRAPSGAPGPRARPAASALVAEQREHLVGVARARRLRVDDQGVAGQLSSRSRPCAPPGRGCGARRRLSFSFRSSVARSPRRRMHAAKPTSMRPPSGPRSAPSSSARAS